MTEAEITERQEMVADLEAERQKRAKPETDQDRFRRAVALQEALAAGETVPADALKWLAHYRQTPEFAGWSDMYEDFGEAMLL